MRGPFAVEFYQCVTYGAYTAEWQEKVINFSCKHSKFTIDAQMAGFACNNILECEFHYASTECTSLVQGNFL